MELFTLSGNFEKPTNQPTDMTEDIKGHQIDREVALPIISQKCVTKKVYLIMVVPTAYFVSN